MQALFIDEIIGSSMWHLAMSYTGHVGYRGAIKAEGLSLNPPVIDCSGWAAFLLSSAMTAVNEALQREHFTSKQRMDVCTWSDRMIDVIHARTGLILEGDQITADELPRFALIGLQQGGGAWALNHPRPRGITHVVVVVRNPHDGAAFVSESQGWAKRVGLRLLPLAEWISLSQPWLKAGAAWAVDPFAPPRSK